MRVKALAALLVFNILAAFFLPIPAYAESLTMDPVQGFVGADVKIPAFCQYGAGDYFLYWGEGNQVIMQGTVRTASCQPITFKVPESSRGKHVVTLKINTKSFQKEFTVLASISPGAKKGPAGSSISVQGTGFAPRESGIKILYDNAEVTTGIEANANGSWIYTIKIPSSSRGNHMITSSGATTPATEVGNQIISVTPSLNINPNSGWVGRTVNVSGTGFAAAETNIAVLYDDTIVKTGTTADLSGSWQTTFTVPASAKGSHRVDAKGATTLVDDVPDAAFSVSPGIKVEQATGRLGDVINMGDMLWVSGVGFRENEGSIKVTFDTMQVASGISADAQGSWSAQFAVPASTHGEHIIDAFGDATGADDVTNYTVLVTPEISVNPDTGAVGENTILSGSGFGSNQPLTITFGSIKIDTSATSDAKGSFSTGFKPPAGGSGNHLITVIDATQAVASTTFTIESSAPQVPVPASPEPGAKISFMENKPLEFKWSAVEDPSGVSYTLELAQKADFSGSVMRKENLEKPGYTVAGNEKPGIGEYYWRVKALDGAGNSSEWSQAQILMITGLEYMWIGMVVLAVILIAGLVIWRIRVISKGGGWSSES
jgi:hypothetical protein